MKGFITILALAIGSVALLGSGYLVYNEINKDKQLGLFSDPFLSIQLADGPDNGEILSTDGTDNVWITSTSGGGAAWEEIWTNTLTPTNTAAGIYVQASSTINADFRVSGNATTTGTLNVGALNAASCDVKSDTNGLLYCGTDANTGGGASAWEEFITNIITPTTTGAGIFVYNATSTIKNLSMENATTSENLVVGAEATGDASIILNTGGTDTWVFGLDDSVADTFVISHDAALGTDNSFELSGTAATTTGYLVVGTANPTVDIPVGGLWAGAATTTNLAVSGLANCNTIDTDANGTMTCGTDATAGSDTPGAWDTIWTNTLSPTNTSAGIFVYASSTFNSDLTVNGMLGATTSFDFWLNASSTVLTEADFAGEWLTAENASTTTFSTTDNASYWATNFTTQWDVYANASSTILTEADFAGEWLSAENASSTTFSTVDNADYWTTNFTIQWDVYTNASSTILTEADFAGEWLTVENASTTTFSTIDNTTYWTANYETEWDALHNASTTYPGFTTQFAAESSTNLSDTADLLYETELDDFSELQTQISDKVLVNEADAATWALLQTFTTETEHTAGMRTSGSVNATTTNVDILKVYTSSNLAKATSSNFAVSGLTSCDAVETNATGDLICGTDADSGGFSSNWHEYAANILTPTNTSAGIFVLASSTITGDFTAIGNTSFQGSATTTNIYASGNWYLDADNDSRLYSDADDVFKIDLEGDNDIIFDGTGANNTLATITATTTFSTPSAPYHGVKIIPGTPTSGIEFY